MKIRKTYIIIGVRLLLGVQSVAAQQLPDTMLTFRHAYYYNITDMPRSLQILQGIRERRLQPEWKTDYVEGNIYAFGRYFQTALKHYKQAQARLDEKVSWEDKAKLVSRMLYCYNKLNDSRYLAKYAHELMDLSKAHGDSAYLAMGYFITGKRNYLMGFCQTGEKICLRAIDMMKHSDFKYKNRELYNFYAALLSMYIEDKRYDDAVFLLDTLENCYRQGFGLPIADNEVRAQARVYALKAHLMARMGRMAAADSAYVMMRAVPYRDITAEYEITHYLKLRNNYEGLLYTTQYAREILYQDGDSIGANMLLLLHDEADAYTGLGRHEEAARSFSALAQLTGVLSQMTEQYISKSSEAALSNERKLSERRFQLSVIIGSLVVVVIILVAFFLYGRQLRHKNKAMMSTIHELMYYRDVVMLNGDPDPVEMDEKEKADVDEKRRFKQVDKQVMKGELFRNPDFGRDNLMRLMGVDKNELATIIHRHTGTNVTGYVNMKRMEYALLLLKKHPELTIAAISESCGIKSTTTFVNRFKEAYGMTPSEFRKSAEITPPRNYKLTFS